MSTAVMFQKILFALALVGCGVPVANSPVVDVVECQAAVLEPLLGDLAEQAVLQINGGGLNPVELFLALGLDPRELAAVARAFAACVEEGPIQLPPAEPEVLQPLGIKLEAY